MLLRSLASLFLSSLLWLPNEPTVHRAILYSLMLWTTETLTQSILLVPSNQSFNISFTLDFVSDENSGVFCSYFAEGSEYFYSEETFGHHYSS